MKHLRTFENFQINEEEEIFGLFADKQKKIERYTKEILEGTISEDLKKDFGKYIASKPPGGIGSDMGQWRGYVTNIDDLLDPTLRYDKKQELWFVDKFGAKAPEKPAAELQGFYDDKKRPAADVIEEEVARMILKDRMVTKKSGKWEIETKGRILTSKTHTFGSGE
jgi:hypothetical protein